MPPNFPLVVPFSAVRRIYPTPRTYKAILEANPGCILGVVSKTGAMPKTATLTRIGMDFHKKTQKVRRRLRCWKGAQSGSARQRGIESTVAAGSGYRPGSVLARPGWCRRR